MVLLANGRVVATDTPAALKAPLGDEIIEIEGEEAGGAVRDIARLIDARVTIRTEAGFRVGVAGSRVDLTALGGLAARSASGHGAARDARGCLLRAHAARRHRDGCACARRRDDVSAASAAYGIVVRDLTRSVRQRGRVLGGIARPFMWLVLVGAGYNAIARIDGVSSYYAFLYPGVIVMAMLFGAMLTAVSTVYDREFGMLRLMLACPSGVGAVLAGRAIAAAIIGIGQGAIVLATMPFVVPMTIMDGLRALGALAAGSLAMSVIGLLIAARLRSVENFAGVINVVLFPLLFLSGALYPTAELPKPLLMLARLNPVAYAVDLTRAALGQAAEFDAGLSLLVLSLTTVVAFGLAAALFDPERRFAGSDRLRKTRA